MSIATVNQWAPTAMSAAAAAVTPATDWRQARRQPGRDPPGGYSLAIPVSRITRSYLAS